MRQLRQLRRQRRPVPPPPVADFGGAWANLRGYVQQAAADGGPIEPSTLLSYMDELRRDAMAPLREWVREWKP